MKSICANCKNCIKIHYSHDFYGYSISYLCKLYKLEETKIDNITGKNVYSKDALKKGKEYSINYEYPKSYYKMSKWKRFWTFIEKEAALYKLCKFINHDGDCKEFILCR